MEKLPSDSIRNNVCENVTLVLRVQYILIYSLTLFFHRLEAGFHYSDPQVQVGKNRLFNLRPNKPNTNFIPTTVI